MTEKGIASIGGGTEGPREGHFGDSAASCGHEEAEMEATVASLSPAREAHRRTRGASQLCQRHAQARTRRALN
ncbi:hypothetical protein E2562_000657 [Oryza meyeriana var. granulata]|uniref:Uncharacterized protein n=1 Tax=Oryza meyeriana var. granulata TaxID=110450 RepID=A0A6G1DTS0_9ORYZ|nr:hypothetical protein E2562_000657 [Oryza meyeriana var. granulata]